MTGNSSKALVVKARSLLSSYCARIGCFLASLGFGVFFLAESYIPYRGKELLEASARGAHVDGYYAALGVVFLAAAYFIYPRPEQKI